MANIIDILRSAKTYSVGIAVGIATWLLAWTVNMFNLVKVLNIGGQPVSTGALSLNVGTAASGMGTANALGVKAMALLTAIPGGLFAQASLLALVTITIGSTILVAIGRWIYSWEIIPKGRPRWKLAVELLYGAIVGTIIVAGIGGVGVSAVITMAIYYGIIALVVMPILTRIKFYARLVRD